MFTGIITNFGKIESLKHNTKKDLLLEVSCDKSAIRRTLEIGCSIACNGICLTLIEKKTAAKEIIFSFQASNETCEKTTLKNWEIEEMTYFLWEVKQKKLIKNWIEIEHSSLSGHELWVPKEKRYHFKEWQTKENEKHP